jgi:hypothetical protein
MELTSSWGAASYAATKKFPNILWKTKVHCRVHRSPALDPTPSQINPVHTTPFSLSKIHHNIVAYRPVARQRLRNNATAAVTIQLRGKHACTTIELLLETVFCTRSMQRSYLEDSCQLTEWVVSCKSACEVAASLGVSCQLRVEFCTRGCEDRTWAREAEGFLLLEAVAVNGWCRHSRLGKGLARAVVICTVWRLAMTL